MMNRGEKLGKQSRPFFYPASMLSADKEHAGMKHADMGRVDYTKYTILYDMLYNARMQAESRAKMQADSITKDHVLAGLISEQIIKYFYIPSIINYEEGGMRLC